MAEPIRIAVLGSGAGSNMQSIQDAIDAGTLNAKIVCVISDAKDAKILDRARRHGIPGFWIDHAPFKTKLDGDAELNVIATIQSHDAELVLLAGYMRIVKKRFLQAFAGRILNIHPSLLPAFPGLHAWQQALDYGAKVAGCTVHFVDEGTDTGPIIVQRCVPVMDDDTPESLHERIQVEEHVAYPEAVRYLCDNKLARKGRVIHLKHPDPEDSLAQSSQSSGFTEHGENERYTLTTKLGEGATGIVYKAHDNMLDMDVAVKILHPSLVSDESAIASIKSEATVAMKLSHTCIIRLYHLAKLGSSYGLVMEYVNGKNFHQLLREAKRFTPHAVTDIVKICSDALNYAHSCGVLHKDLKPSNLLLNSEGVIKIIDFGVSCLVDHQRDIGEIAGTPQYMSPEHLRGEVLGPQADIYALGIMAYQFLTGKLPFDPDFDFTSFDIPERLPLDEATPNIRTVLETATDPDPASRYMSISDFGHAFDYAFRLDFPNDRHLSDTSSGGFSI